MIEEAPDPKEISTFHFTQLRTLKFAKSDEKIPNESINLIASASKYGLLFIGIENGFKILKTENILDLNEDKENKKIEENFYSKVVVTETPTLLSLSNDQKTLAVCVYQNSTAVANMYDIASFSDLDQTPLPFMNVQLSSGNSSKLKELIWNPVAEGTYAYCLSDGSLHVHDITGTKLTIIASLLNANATSASWSPKGKQIVVGKKDGSFSQYKPTLQEVKNIPPPNIEEKLSIINICWIATTQFAVAYIPRETPNSSPFLFMVSTPKNSPVSYINYYDVCLGNASSLDQRYFIHHEPSWGILICASTDSIEIAVLGESPNWVQWDVKEDGRALLPAKDDATHAVAYGVVYSSQRALVMSEIECYPPMPIIFFLTNNGLLVSYHMINSAHGSASLVCPTTSIGTESDRKRTGPQMPIQQSNITITSVDAMKTPVKPESSPSTVLQSSPQNKNNQSLGIGSSSPFAFGSSKAFQGTVAPQQKAMSELPFQSPTTLTPSLVPHFQVQQVVNTSPDSERFHKTSKSMASANVLSSNINRDTSGGRHMAVAQRLSTSGKASKENVDNQNTYISAIYEEIRSFERELQELKNSQQVINIGTREEMENLKSFTLNFEDFQKEMSDTMISLNSDTHSLKNSLLESFVIIEEVNSRERRKNDHVYQSMLKDRSLDPMTAKRMQKIEQHYLYLNTQLREVNDKLDQDLFEYLERTQENRKSIRHISSAEAVYKTIVNNQNTIHNLRKSVDHVEKQASKKKLENISKKKTHFIKKCGPEELSKLADAFLQTKITNLEEERVIKTKKISHEAEDKLKNFLSSSSVAIVRPSISCSPSQSRLLSKSLVYGGYKKSDLSADANRIEHDAVAMQSKSALASEQLSSQFIASRNIGLPMPQTNVYNAFKKISDKAMPTSTVYEDISPPTTPELDYSNKTTSRSLEPSSNLGFQFITKSDYLPGKTIDAKSTSFTTPSSVGQLTQALSNLSSAKAVQFYPPNTITKTLDNRLGDTENKQAHSVLAAQSSFVFPSSNSGDVKELGTSTDSLSQQFPVAASIMPKISDKTISSVFSSVTASIPNAANLSNFTTPSKSAGSIVPKSTEYSFIHPLGTSTPFTTLTTKDANPNSISNVNATRDISSFIKNHTNILDVSLPVQKTESTIVSSKTPSISTQPAKPLVSFLAPSSSETTNQFPLNFSQKLNISTTASAVIVSPTPSSKVSSAFNSSNCDLNISSALDVSKLIATSSASGLSISPLVTSLSQSAASTALSSGPGFGITSTTATESVLSSMLDQSISTTSGKLNTSTQNSVFGLQNSSTVSAQNIDPATSESASDQSKSSIVMVQTTSIPKAIFSQLDSVVPSSISVPEHESTTVSASEPQDDEPRLPDEPIDKSIILSYLDSVNASPTLHPTSSTESVLSTSLLTAAPTSFPSTTSLSAFQVSTSTPSITTATVFPVTAPISTIPTATSTQSFSVTSSSFPASTKSTFFSAVTTATTTPNFGQTSTGSLSFFGQASPAPASVFGKASETSAFGQSAVSPNSAFGTTTTTTSSNLFPQSTGTFFSQPVGNTSVFGGNVATSENSVFGNQNSSFTFGKSPFGQASGSFGLAKSVFTQPPSPAPPPAFGQASSPPQNSAFSQSSGNGVFGQGSFFGGLGGKPSAENAAKNVFAMGTVEKPMTDTSVFGGTSAFGSKAVGSFSGGSFTSGGNSVAQSGFGAFQQSPQKTGGFGAAPSFGGSPAFGGSAAFGSPPAFGSSPSFGAGSPLGSIFGSPQPSNFSNFASSSSPTFGTLASQNQGYVSPQQPVFGQQTSVFGGNSAFGGAPAFGGGGGAGVGGQPQSFGNAGSPQANSSAFTQWRN